MKLWVCYHNHIFTICIKKSYQVELGKNICPKNNNAIQIQIEIQNIDFQKNQI